MKFVYKTAVGNQNILYGLLFVGGVLMAYLSTNGFDTVPSYKINQNEFAALLLGGFIMLLGFLGLVMQHTREVVVDGEMKLFSITDAYFGKKKEQTIIFSDVAQVIVRVFGIKYASRINDVVLILKDGREVPLFFTTYTHGTFSRREMERRRDEIESLITKDT